MNRQPRSAEEEGLMALQMRRVGKVTVIVLSGKLNTEAAQDLKRELNDYCDRSPGHSLLDMSEVNYVSSYLIGVLVACHEKLKASGSELHLAGVDPKLRMVLESPGSGRSFPATRRERPGSRTSTERSFSVRDRLSPGTS
jgi:anti-anti-sigma factor